MEKDKYYCTPSEQSGQIMSKGSLASDNEREETVTKEYDNETQNAVFEKIKHWRNHHSGMYSNIHDNICYEGFLNFIDDLSISERLILAYIYTNNKNGEWTEFIVYRRFMELCAISSTSTVTSILNNLVKLGYIEKKEERNNCGHRLLKYRVTEYFLCMRGVLLQDIKEDKKNMLVEDRTNNSKAENINNVDLINISTIVDNGHSENSEIDKEKIELAKKAVETLKRNKQQSRFIKRHKQARKYIDILKAGNMWYNHTLAEQCCYLSAIGVETIRGKSKWSIGSIRLIHEIEKAATNR